MELLELNMLLVSNSFLFLVVRPGAPSSVLAPSSDALLLVALNIELFLN